MMTDLLALPAGSERTYTWTLYLGIAQWQIAVFGGGRVMGLGR